MRNIKDAYMKQHKGFQPDNEFQLKKAVEEACGNVLPSHTVADQGKVLVVADDGSMEFSSDLLKLMELVTATVTFNSNGGSSVQSQTVTFGHTATEPTAPTKSGKVFGGWFEDSELTSAFSFTTKIKANITLYAKWNDEE